MAKYSFYTITIYTFTILLSCTGTVAIDEENTPFQEIENTSDTISDDETSIISKDISTLKTWDWKQIEIPPYTWTDGIAFGDGLYANIAFDPLGVQTQNNQLRF